MGQSLKPSPWWKTEHCNRPASYILLDHKSTNLFILIEFKAKWRAGHVEYVYEHSGKKKLHVLVYLTALKKTYH